MYKSHKIWQFLLDLHHSTSSSQTSSTFSTSSSSNRQSDQQRSIRTTSATISRWEGGESGGVENYLLSSGDYSEPELDALFTSSSSGEEDGRHHHDSSVFVQNLSGTAVTTSSGLLEEYYPVKKISGISPESRHPPLSSSSSLYSNYNFIFSGTLNLDSSSGSSNNDDDGNGGHDHSNQENSHPWDLGSNGLEHGYFYGEYGEFESSILPPLSSTTNFLENIPIAIGATDSTGGGGGGGDVVGVGGVVGVGFGNGGGSEAGGPDGGSGVIDFSVSWTSVLIMTMLVVVTIVGNVLVCLSVILVRKLRKPQNYLLVSLAVSDLFVAIFVMPFAILMEFYQSNWPLNAGLCDFWVSADVLCCTASILNLCAISLDRFQAITAPFDYSARSTPRRMLAVIFIVWLGSACVSLPPVLLLGNEYVDSTGVLICSVSQNFWYQIYATMASFYIPLCVMVVVYAKILRVVTDKKKEMNWKKKKHSGNSCSLQVPPPTTGLGFDSRRHSSINIPMSNVHATATSTLLNCRKMSLDPTADTTAMARTTMMMTTIGIGGSSTSQPPDPDEGGGVCGGGLSSSSSAASASYAASFQQSAGQNVSSPSQNIPIPMSASKFRSSSTVAAPSSTGAAAVSSTNTNPAAVAAAAAIRLTLLSHKRKSRGSVSGGSTCGTHPSLPGIENSGGGGGVGGFRKRSRSTCSPAEIKLTTMREDNNDPPPRQRQAQPQSQPQPPPPVSDNSSSGGSSSHDYCNSKGGRSLNKESWDKDKDYPPTPVHHQHHKHKQLPRIRIGRALMPCVSGSTRNRRKSRLFSGLKEHKASTTLGIIMSAFIICWLPFFVLALFRPIFHVEIPDWISSLFNWLGYANSALNPVIYATLNRDFRRPFREILSFRCATLDSLMRKEFYLEQYGEDTDNPRNKASVTLIFLENGNISEPLL